MFDLFMGVILWGIGLYAAKNVLGILRELNEISKRTEAEGEALAELPPEIVSVFFEKVPEHDTILCFSEDNRFLCQGKTFEEVRKNFSRRFPELTAIVQDTESKLLYVEAMRDETQDKQ